MGKEKVVSDGVTVAAGFPKKVITVTATNQGAVIMTEWIEPWLWYSAGVLLVNVPSYWFSNFIAIGLAWIWNEFG
jgi:hypothetical protein